ncbi:phosphatase PAP2 family protein [Oxalobacteraceae bacterium OM1]|nr:phosphatase PAP2 family protein [Oxalobacteraceae bacterium OM1]
MQRPRGRLAVWWLGRGRCYRRAADPGRCRNCELAACPRVAIVLTAMSMVLLVSFSRLYLGVHYLTDVLAGMAEGLAWLSLCFVSVHTYLAHRAARLKKLR